MIKYLILVPAVLADMDQMQDKLNKFLGFVQEPPTERQATEGLGGLEGLPNPMSLNRAFTGSIGKTISSINEYGCWCYFGDDHGRGKGQPQDAIDEMCKILADGYECAMRDAEDEGTTCVPWEVQYTSAIGGSDVGIAGECSQNNPDSNCAARACTIEGAFVANLLDAFVSGNGIDNSMKHSNGFDQPTICATKKNGGGPTNKACCGSYPDRFPFKTIGGDRKCCGNRTFNSLTLKCCDADSSTVKFNC